MTPHLRVLSLVFLLGLTLTGCTPPGPTGTWTLDTERFLEQNSSVFAQATTDEERDAVRKQYLENARFTLKLTPGETLEERKVELDLWIPALTLGDERSLEGLWRVQSGRTEIRVIGFDAEPATTGTLTVEGETMLVEMPTSDGSMRFPLKRSS